MGKLKKTFCFDLDNVICETKKTNYKKSKPVYQSIKILNELYKRGSKIIIFTGRHFGKCNGNLKKIIKTDKGLTKNQLQKWGVKYHRLFFGKPVFDIYLDDKNFEFKTNWPKQFRKKYLINKK